MTSVDYSGFSAIGTQIHLIILAALGGLILFAFSVAEHFNKKEEDKLAFSRYALWFLFLFFGLPFLGVVMVAVYIMNGDKLSALLAFQVGLTSPAIVKAFMSAAANKMAKSSGSKVLQGQ